VTLNLARHPFANLRPMRRLGIALWVVGGLAVLTAGWLFVSYLIGSSEKRAALTRLEEERAGESQRLIGLRSQLARFELAAQNREVDYLNERIAERTFAWSRLFDDLAEVLPWNVRIVSLSPLSITPARRDARGQRDSEPGEEFALRLVGGARDGEALLVFVDRLFAHPAFGHPDLEGERNADGEVQFSVTVTYRPRRDGAPPAVLASAINELSTPGQAEAQSTLTAPSAGPVASAVIAPDVAPATPGGGSPRPAAGAVPYSPPPTGNAPLVQAELAPAPLVVEPGGWPDVLTGGLSTAAPPQPEPLPLADPYSSSVGIR
jgi:Tfp pilus assembly protein PilN